MITTAQLFAKYGKPTETGSQYLVTLKLPYPMVLAWDKSTKVTSIRCHKLVADKLKNIFEQILAAYGIDQIKALGIDIYGGCFNYRKMRGGTEWSRHSWAVAIDLDPDRNQLKENHTTARFARPEYKQMIDIFYANGFEGLGIEQDRDWMHFQVKE
jgi:hypothetical protein